MDLQLKQEFSRLWAQYFPGAELPITLAYADSSTAAEVVVATAQHHCLICDLAKVRNGISLAFDEPACVCGGAKRYLGFTDQLRPGFEYFLSCGIPGQMEGERYKKSPEIVLELMAKAPEFTAPAKYAIFKRWDKLAEVDEPQIVIFFAKPDVLSGLFTLCGFDTAELEAVIAPFAAGCGSIVQYPYLELKREQPRAVLGMFDVSARPFVPAETLTFAVPMPKFRRMAEDMQDSFLITESWQKVRARL